MWGSKWVVSGNEGIEEGVLMVVCLVHSASES